eukprot:ANDGO_07046.mRNA.1 hypothetical protein
MTIPQANVEAIATASERLIQLARSDMSDALSKLTADSIPTLYAEASSSVMCADLVSLYEIMLQMKPFTLDALCAFDPVAAGVGARVEELRPFFSQVIHPALAMHHISELPDDHFARALFEWADGVFSIACVLS